MTSAIVLPSALPTEVLLDVFDRPVAFHRCPVPIAGGVAPALMLSAAIDATHALAPASQGWFTRSQGEWHEETGLSRREQETARRALRTAGFLEERRVGLPARLWFRVRTRQVCQALYASAGGSSRAIGMQARP